MSRPPSMRRAEPVVPRGGVHSAAQRGPPVSMDLSAPRLYIHNTASLTTRSALAGDASKFESLSSVSPTSSTRELSMRSLSSQSSDEDVNGTNRNHKAVHHLTNVSHQREQQRRVESRTSQPTTTKRAQPLESNRQQSDELQHIKESVERLRAQRAHVEQLRQRNERLELLLADRSKETEKLRLQVASLRGVEQENVGLLKSFQMLEERIRTLEATCNERREDARIAHDRLASVEKARDTLQLRVDELSGEREYYRKQISTLQETHEKRIQELQATNERALERVQRSQSEWQAKLEDAQLSQSHVEAKFQDELGLLQSENQELVRENRALEQHVQQLLATTVRQTTMIEDCDRLLHESKSRHATAKASYRDQLKLNATLQEQIKQLEIQLAAFEQGVATEKHTLEAKLLEVETKARKLKDKHEIYVVALKEKENHCEKLQNELAVRDRARLHAEEVVKELRQQDKTLLSQISTLKVTLSDLTDEKSILQDQLRSLQEQLEKERKDRSHWATARLKLLAEFCDEENKLSSALHPYSALGMLVEEGSETLLEGDFGEGEDNNDEGVDVEAAVMAAGLKMDALDQKYHGRTSAHEAVRQRPPGKSIVFG